MTIVEWAYVVLPLVALVGGVYLSWKHAAAIDHWVRVLDREMTAWSAR